MDTVVDVCFRRLLNPWTSSPKCRCCPGQAGVPIRVTLNTIATCKAHSTAIHHWSAVGAGTVSPRTTLVRDRCDQLQRHHRWLAQRWRYLTQRRFGTSDADRNGCMFCLDMSDTAWSGRIWYVSRLHRGRCHGATYVLQ